MKLDTRPRLIMADDEPEIRNVIVELLSEDFDIRSAQDGAEVLELAKTWSPELFLLDLNMPNLDGFETCRKIRESSAFNHIPILFLTAYGGSEQRIRAFSGGADDYISKPFDAEEIRTRLLSRLVRNQQIRQGPAPAAIRLGNLSLDPDSRRAFIGDEAIPLSPLEFSILQVLSSNAGKIVTREELIAEAWVGSPETQRAVDVQITLLRKKLGDFSGEIRSVYGRGYCMNAV